MGPVFWLAQLTFRTDELFSFQVTVAVAVVGHHAVHPDLSQFCQHSLPFPWLTSSSWQDSEDESDSMT